MPKKSELNAKQQLFCREYMKDRNATRAYKEIYKCSDGVANVNGPRLLVNARVKDFIDKESNKITVKAKITVEEVIDGLKEIAEYGREKDPETGKMKDATVSRNAYQDLGKHLKMFTDKVEVDGDITVNIKNYKEA